MLPVLTAAEMSAVDAKAVAAEGLDALVARAGHAVARGAIAMLGGAYGRRVVVVAGKGHNGDDGRVAATLLSGRGAHVTVCTPPGPTERCEIPPCDLVIDAAYGTGFRGTYRAPVPPPGALVLAVDVPSGLVADTGEAEEGSVVADVTVTFGALKPGLVLGRGPELAGRIEVDAIGLPVGDPALHLVEDADVTAWCPPRPRDDHKWRAAVFLLAGSPQMPGAARLAATAALRAGAGMLRVGTPGVAAAGRDVSEAVSVNLDESDFADTVLSELARCRSLVVGPGLGTSPRIASEVAAILGRTTVPAVVDADGLRALSGLLESGWRPTAGAHLVLTPHDGEFDRLTGSPPGSDRVAAVRALASSSGATVLLKGPTTVIATPGGEALLVNSGSPRLATAGTGDVLSGCIGALLARGCPPLRAAGVAAHVHGRAAARGRRVGLVASDLPVLVAAVLSDLVGPRT